MLRFAMDFLTWAGAALLLWVACPVDEHVNAWGFAFTVDDWSWAWIGLTLGTALMSIRAYAAGWEQRL